MEEKSGSFKSSSAGSVSSGSTADSKSLLQRKKSCVKKVHRNKYERGNSDTQKYWRKTFQDIEEQSAIPFFKRKSHLEKCFSKDTMKKLIDIGIECYPDWGEDIEKEKVLSIIEPPPESDLVPRKKKKEVPEVEYTNPYLNFFKKSKNDAQVWRPSPPPPLQSLPIIEKAKAVEEKLATEFDDWFSKVGSNKKSEINKEVILSIFEVLITFPAKTSMSQQIKEIGCVPEMTAKYIGFPEKSESNSVQREIYRDINAGNMEPMLVSFFKTLPDEMKREPFTENLEDKWFTYEAHNVDIETFAAVWNGITELHTTQLFIDFLLNHPEIPIPWYLHQGGFLKNRSYLKSCMDLGIGEDLEWDVDTSLRSSIGLQGEIENIIQDEDDDFDGRKEY